MGRRIWILFRARLAAGPRGGAPVAALLAQALFAALFCGLVNDLLPPFAYGVFALSLTGALLAIPLLGELGSLLMADEAHEWTASLPVRPFELRASRVCYLLLCLFGLALASLLPAAALAPADTAWVARLAFPVCGLGLASVLAAVLLGAFSVLRGRAEGLLVLLQMILVIGVVVGVVGGLGRLPELARFEHLGAERAAFLWAYPPAWFAAPMTNVEGQSAQLGLIALTTLGALLVLFAMPSPRAGRRARREPWLALLLRPARIWATRWWCRRDERASFDLLYDALPREREVVLRTYPMVGIPIAFLLIAVAGEAQDSSGRRDFMTILLFTASIYLPLLITHVPASSSHRARWLFDCSPVPEGAVIAGTLKALGVRFVLPLYLVLGVMAWMQAGLAYALALAPAGFLMSLIIMRSLYGVCVDRAPLSIPPDEVRTNQDWLGLLAGLALGLTVFAILANRFLVRPLPALGLIATLVLLEALGQRALRRRLG